VLSETTLTDKLDAKAKGEWTRVVSMGPAIEVTLVEKNEASILDFNPFVFVAIKYRDSLQAESERAEATWRRVQARPQIRHFLDRKVQSFVQVFAAQSPSGYVDHSRPNMRLTSSTSCIQPSTL
jgi:hypothetical protein